MSMASESKALGVASECDSLESVPLSDSSQAAGPYGLGGAGLLVDSDDSRADGPHGLGSAGVSVSVVPHSCSGIVRVFGKVYRH